MNSMNIRSLFWIDLGFVVFNTFAFNMNIYSLCNGRAITGWFLFMIVLNVISNMLVIFSFQSLCHTEESRIRREQMQTAMEVRIARATSITQDLIEHYRSQRDEEIKVQEEAQKQAEATTKPETNNPIQFMELVEKDAK